MSIIHEKSPKHCAEKQATKSHKSKKKLFLYVSTFFLSLLSLILLLWLFLHPKNPHFSLSQAHINQLNITSTFLNSSIHLTLLSTNPNKNVGIYYDTFLLHAYYNTHLITPNTPIPPFYQDHRETKLLSASLLGNRQPVDPSQAYQLHRDQATGKLALDFKVTGRLRWKVGKWISRRYRFNVDCITTVSPLGRKVSTSKQGIMCSTSI